MDLFMEIFQTLTDSGDMSINTDIWQLLIFA